MQRLFCKFLITLCVLRAGNAWAVNDKKSSQDNALQEVTGNLPRASRTPTNKNHPENLHDQTEGTTQENLVALDTKGDQRSQTVHLLDLYPEIVAHIALHLPVKDIDALQCTSKSLHATLKHDVFVKKHIERQQQQQLMGDMHSLARRLYMCQSFDALNQIKANFLETLRKSPTHVRLICSGFSYSKEQFDRYFDTTKLTCADLEHMSEENIFDWCEKQEYASTYPTSFQITETGVRVSFLNFILDPTHAGYAFEALFWVFFDNRFDNNTCKPLSVMYDLLNTDAIHLGLTKRKQQKAHDKIKIKFLKTCQEKGFYDPGTTSFHDRKVGPSADDHADNSASEDEGVVSVKDILLKGLSLLEKQVLLIDNTKRKDRLYFLQDFIKRLFSA